MAQAVRCLDGQSLLCHAKAGQKLQCPKNQNNWGIIGHQDARELTIIWGSDTRYWKWEGMKIGGHCMEVAELINVCWLEINGKHAMKKLTEGLDYQVKFVVKLLNNFNIDKPDIREETGKEPTLFELFIRLHTKDKDNKEFTSEAVRIIVEQYLAKCVEHNEDPHRAPIDTWVEVVGVRKNAILGTPRSSASELIPLPPTSGKRRRRRSVDDESGASTGRSIIEHIADDFVMQAVDRTVAFARAHPDQFDLAPEQINVLAQSVAEGVSDLPSDHPLTMTTMRELVQVMVSVLGDVYASNRPTTSDCRKGKSIAREDENHSDDEDDGRQSPPASRRPSGNRSGGIWIRGD